MPRIVIALRLTEGRANETVPKAGISFGLCTVRKNPKRGGIYDKV